MSEPPEHLLTVRQVAEHLRVSTATVYALVDRGELRHVRISNAIRVNPAELQAYIEQTKNLSTPPTAKKATKKGNTQ